MRPMKRTWDMLALLVEDIKIKTLRRRVDAMELLSFSWKRVSISAKSS